MVIFHSYVKLPEGTHQPSTRQIHQVPRSAPPGFPRLQLLFLREIPAPVRAQKLLGGAQLAPRARATWQAGNEENGRVNHQKWSKMVI